MLLGLLVLMAWLIILLIKILLNVWIGTFIIILSSSKFFFFFFGLLLSRLLMKLRTIIKRCLISSRTSQQRRLCFKFLDASDLEPRFLSLFKSLITISFVITISLYWLLNTLSLRTRVILFCIKIIASLIWFLDLFSL